MNHRRGFTLVEMVVAVVIASLLTAAVLAAASGIARDRQKFGAFNQGDGSKRVLEMLRWDLTNASSFSSTAGEIRIDGHGGIDPRTLLPNNRLTRVTFRLRRIGATTAALFREQEYLDDPIRPQRWSELVADGVKLLAISPESGDAATIPARVGVRIETAAGSKGEELWIR